MELMEAIMRRRSIRSYRSDEVSEELLNKILEAARWAPSWANTQCWEFIIVKDKQTKEKLAETLPPPNPARGALSTAPIVIVACGRKGKAGFYKGTVTTVKGDWFMFDVALAMQNLTLAAHSLGLGTVHVGLFDSQKAEEILGVPDEVEVVEMTPLGFPDKESKAPPRKELKDFVFYESYGKK
ncbi:MAG: nitroreductase family protein [Deltaproteobacteria bacterium]|nr:MAG: nitroreductase family protein [Deltaproteobacteria bacterium]